MAEPGIGALASLIIFIVASVWLGALAHRVVQRGAFLKGYFLGNRGLGAWAVALTATVQSGGTFMGYPSFVYSHGWIVAVWIGSYMIVPLVAFGVIGKRLAQLSRRTGAITVPDLFRERFGNPTVGLVASLFILIFMSAMMVAQFKAGANVMKVAWPKSGKLSLSEELSHFQLTAESLERLQKQRLPESTLAKLQPLRGARFENEREFVDRLSNVLSSEELTTYRTAIVRQAQPLDWLYYLGLAIFTLTVVGYTLIGGFLAAVWTDLFQSVMMFVGVILLLILTLSAAGGLDHASTATLDHPGPAFAFGPGYSVNPEWQFLPPSLALSFFFVWTFTNIGSPSGVVRVMACKSTDVLRRSMFILSWYNLLIYIPLVLICVCGRVLIPDLKPEQSDEIIPRLALETTNGIKGGSWISGLILAAPFGAVMATVSSYLVVIASGLVRDIYQRFLNPVASVRTIRRLSYGTMIAVGAIAILLNIRPVQYLQAVVIFSGTCSAATMVVPLLMTAFWRRATAGGAIAAMVAGATAVFGLYVTGWLPFGWQQPMGENTAFRPYYLLGLHPIMWGLAASLLAGMGFSFISRQPESKLISQLFDAPQG